MTFNKTYFFLSVLLFLIEVVIATYIHDKIIRPFVGDILVVMLMYCSIKSFFNTDIIKTAIGVLLFAFFIETLQAIHFIQIIGLEQNIFARLILGSAFTWVDILCYIAGVFIVLIFELAPSKVK